MEPRLPCRENEYPAPPSHSAVPKGRRHVATGFQPVVRTVPGNLSPEGAQARRALPRRPDPAFAPSGLGFLRAIDFHGLNARGYVPTPLRGLVPRWPTRSDLQGDLWGLIPPCPPRSGSFGVSNGAWIGRTPLPEFGASRRFRGSFQPYLSAIRVCPHVGKIATGACVLAFSRPRRAPGWGA